MNELNSQQIFSCASIIEHYDNLRDCNYLMSDEWRIKLIKDLTSAWARLSKIPTQECLYMSDLFQKAARELNNAHMELQELKAVIKKESKNVQNETI